MEDVLNDDCKQLRGMEIHSVGVASISYDEESQKLINMRNHGAMLGNPSVREGYMRMGIGMQSAGTFMGAASNTNMQQMQMQTQVKINNPKTDNIWI